LKAHGWLGKQIKRTGVPEGSYTVELRAIVDAQWSVKKAAVDQYVDIKVDVIGIASGETATISIYEQTRSSDIIREVIETSVSGIRSRRDGSIRRKKKTPHPRWYPRPEGRCT